jgi:hypothetical protein
MRRAQGKRIERLAPGRELLPGHARARHGGDAYGVGLPRFFRPRPASAGHDRAGIPGGRDRRGPGACLDDRVRPTRVETPLPHDRSSELIPTSL